MPAYSFTPMSLLVSCLCLSQKLEKSPRELQSVPRLSPRRMAESAPGSMEALKNMLFTMQTMDSEQDGGHGDPKTGHLGTGESEAAMDGATDVTLQQQVSKHV